MKEWIMNFIQQYGYISLFSLMILENLFPPIPSEVILTFMGFMISQNRFQMIGSIVVATLGSFIGTYILYSLGKLLTPEYLNQFLKSFLAKKLHFKKENIEKTEDYFLRFGTKFVFFGRFIPMIRSFISIPAGMSQMPLFTFSLYSLLGTLIWDTLLIFIGFYLGYRWELIKTLMNDYKIICLIVFLCLIVYWLIKKVSLKNKR